MAKDKTPIPADATAQSDALDKIAEEIVRVSEAFKVINRSRLTKRAIMLLIRDSTSPQIGLNDIEVVLSSAASLAERYIKPPAKQ